MSKLDKKTSSILIALTTALALASGSAFADKPAWAGEGKNKHQEKKERAERSRENDQRSSGITFSFGNNDRRLVSDYYGNEARSGKCPPGLAKKNNGCQPPGQAKKWQRGKPLPKDLRYYELPNELRIRLPVPPPNHRYVQVAGDILMIAIGSSMVIDAIEDILR